MGSTDLTRDILGRVDSLTRKGDQAGGAGGRTTYDAFLAAEQAWTQLRNMPASPEPCENPILHFLP